MDQEWYEKTKDLKEPEQWSMLYEQRKDLRPDDRSIWLPKKDINIWAELLMHTLSFLFRDMKIKSFVDVGCSDCYWQSNMDWSTVEYTGLDIVPEITEYNRENY